MKNAIISHAVRLIAGLLLCVICAVPALSASLLPPGKNCFFTAAGVPNASGTATFYIPSTTTPKDTWTDADQTVLNINPVTLDAAGCAVIYGVGIYRQILKDSLGNTIWDQPTAAGHALNESWSGASGGSANAQTLTNAEYNGIDGDLLYFLATFSNSGPMTIDVNGDGAVAVVRDGGSGPVALVGGEVISGNVVGVVYSSTTGQFHLITPTTIQAFDSALYFSGVITPTILAADQNDWTPSGGFSTANTVRVSASSAIAITGLTGGGQGRIVIFHNVGSFAITFVSQSTASIAANRFLFPSTLTLLPNDRLMVQYDATTGITAWRDVSSQLSMPVAAGYKNLLIVNGGTPNNQILATADAATLEDTNGQVVRRTSLSCTADVTVAGAGGLDSGGVAANIFYSYWFIYNSATNTDSCLLSTSATAPSMPSGYTFKARVGWNRTGGASTFHRVRQIGNVAQYVVTAGTPTADLIVLAAGAAGTYSATAPVFSAITTSAVCHPSTAAEIAITVMFSRGGGAGASVLVAPNAAYTGRSGTTSPPLVADSGIAFSLYGKFVLEATTIQWASSAAGGAVLCNGWTDRLP